MREKLLWLLLCFLAIYMIMPWILTRILGWGVLRRGQKTNQIALTFDDGPDPVYTPKLLDLLQLHQVKATFFVLGERAARYPDLIRRMHAEGHQIGIHNYTHFSNWLMSPRSVKRKHVNRSADIIESITGERPTCYRPPWGVMNLIDYFLKKEYDIVLWSLMAKDWRSSVGTAKLKQRLLKQAKNGSVILLHDCGDTFGANGNAPQFMLEALADALNEWNKREVHCVRIDEMFTIDRPFVTASMSTPKWLLVSLWMVWERCFVKLFNIAPVDKDNPLLQLRVRAYTGDQELALSDGELIRKGDRIAELHLNNDMLIKFGVESRNNVHLAIRIIRGVEQLMPQILQMLNTDPKYQDVKGLYGISIIHRGTTNLGFTVIDLPEGLFSRMTRFYLRVLMYVIHPKGKERIRTKRDNLVPKIIAISRKEMMNRYIA